MKPVYIIAEAGVNHNGKKELAFNLIDIACKAKVDAIKFQTFKAKKMATSYVRKANYQIASTTADEGQLDMLEKLELPRDLYFELKEYAADRGLDFLSSAFDLDSQAFLDELDLPLIKVASGELTNAPLIWSMARTQKPIILSTGMAEISEIENALAIIFHGYKKQLEPSSMKEVWSHWRDNDGLSSLRGRVTLLHCTSLYPTPMHKVNLRCMDTLSDKFGLEVGYSDHTIGIQISLAAVARGAMIIEKHFTVDRGLSGPDHQISLNGNELSVLVSEIRSLENALGDGVKLPCDEELSARLVSRQQIVATQKIDSGSLLTKNNLSTARAGAGILPTKIWDLIGTTAMKNYNANDVIDQ